jgi:hypothetical protein
VGGSIGRVVVHARSVVQASFRHRIPAVRRRELVSMFAATLCSRCRGTVDPAELSEIAVHAVDIIEVCRRGPVLRAAPFVGQVTSTG